MKLVYCNAKGEVFDHIEFDAAFRSGRQIVKATEDDLIPLPYGSFLFSLPGRTPYYFDKKGNQQELTQIARMKIFAASAFLSSGYLRTYLPAYKANPKSKTLSLWAYSGVVFKDEQFYVPALRIDKDKRSDPELHDNDPQLKEKIKEIKAKYPKNRLIKQLSLCSLEYRCLCARNFFLGRFEAPIPTSPACNARCLGCLSLQEESDFKESQYRLNFAPTPQEISETILHHFKKLKTSVASFGQGCEGEPLLRGKDLALAIAQVREKCAKGTINLNTNGSKPEMVKAMIDAGLDSIRISLNSPTQSYYDRYYRPQNYKFSDVLKTIDLALKAQIFVSINLFFLPGMTDSEKEVKALYNFLQKYPVDMIQTRNLNIDPDFYLDTIEFKESNALGVKNLVSNLRSDFPNMRLGYYNPILK